MKHNFIKRYFPLLLLLLVVGQGFSQEVLTGLSYNVQIRKENARVRMRGGDSTVYEAVKLPFVDDFSNYVGFPNPVLWQDRAGFVNASYPLNPPTLGVMTLDALNAEGKIYEHASSSPFGADTMTSRPIRLDSVFATPQRPLTLADAIYFSFYYQPGGGAYINDGNFLEWERRGDQPETDDSLVVEFGYETGDTVFLNRYVYGDYILESDHEAGDTIWNPFIATDFVILENFADSGTVFQMPMDSIFGPEQVWNRVWATPGCSLDDWLLEDSLRYFKQVLIPIADEQYLRNNFQFRFRNYASLEDNGIVGMASNVDQWHIDYVQLHYNRTVTDSFPNDVAFVIPPLSLLKNYQAMPWNQFRQSELITRFDNKISNLSDGIQNVKYTYYIYDENNAELKHYTTNNFNANPYYPSGLHTYAPHATPAADFTLPTNNADSALFRAVHVFAKEGYNDVRTCNDTAIFEQKFYNYYAYDDGVAENGYSILSNVASPEIYFAMRFTLNEPDTLRAVRMWFNPVLNDANLEPFTLMVWNNAGGEPGEVLYSQEAVLPAHEEDYLDFVTYFLEEPLNVSGTFYVGFYQTHNVQLNLGFDCNNDGREHFLYKIANEWRQPFLKGVPMVRPVLGKYFKPKGVSVEEQSVYNEMQWMVYPNPATDYVTMASDNDSDLKTAELFDLTGKLLRNKTFYQSEEQFDLSDFAQGIYLLKLTVENQKPIIKKIIKK